MNKPPVRLDTLFDFAIQQHGGPFSITVHLGAGQGAPELHRARASAQLVLVEGDAEAAAELRARCQALDLRAQVMPVVVAPATGTTLWHRYNLSPLSGLFDAQGMQAWYPRLQEIDVSERQAVGIDALLDDITGDAPDAAGASDRLLVIDLPGQEDALITGVGESRLKRFHWILVRRWRDRPDGPPASGEAARRLLDCGYVARHIDPPSDSLMQHDLYVFDIRHDTMTRAVRERDEALARLALAAAENERLRGDAQERASELGVSERRCREAQERAQALAAELAEVTSRHQDTERALATRAAELDGANKALSEERKQSKARAQRIEQLEAEVAELRFRFETLQHELLKAEGQLDVVKDLLLNESTL